MLQWKPRRILGTGLGVVAAIVLLALAALLFRLVTSQPVSLLSFVMGLFAVLSVLASAFIAYQIYGLVSLRYFLGRDSIVISWARRKETIPLAAIESIDPLVDQSARLARRGLRWPGYCIVGGRDERGRELLSYSNGRRLEELLITTAVASYIISPDNPTGFLLAVRGRQRLGPARKLEQVRTEGGLGGLAVWRDWKALGLAVMSAVANAGLFAYIAFRYPQLPEIVPLLSEAGQVTLIGAREELFQLPVIGLTVVLAITVVGFAFHRRERLLTYILGAIAVLVQILVWSAALSAIR
jgi:hypothetical protein